MADQFTTRQNLPFTLSFEKDDGTAGVVEAGTVEAASADETVATVTMADDGMSGVVGGVAPSPLDDAGAPIPTRIVVTADADTGPGVRKITGIGEVICVLDPRDGTTTVRMTFGPAVDKP